MFLHVAAPGDQFVNPGQDRGDLLIGELRRNLKVIPGHLQVVLRPLPAGRLRIAELAVVSGFELALALKGHPRSWAQHGVGPFQQVGLAHLEGGNVVPPWLENAHPHGGDVVDPVEGLQQPQRIAHHLRIPFGTHHDSDAVFQIDHVEHIVGHNAGVPGAESFRHPAGEVQPLLHQNDGVRAVLLRLGQLLHHKRFISIGAVCHLGIEVVQILRRVSCRHAQRFLHLISRKAVCVRTLLGIRRSPVRVCRAQLGAGRAVQPAVAGGSGKQRMVSHGSSAPPAPDPGSGPGRCPSGSRRQHTS